MLIASTLFASITCFAQGKYIELHLTGILPEIENQNLFCHVLSHEKKLIRLNCIEQTSIRLRIVTLNLFELRIELWFKGLENGHGTGSLFSSKA